MMKRETEKTKLALTIDSKLKKEFAQLCEDIGLPMSSVVSALMSQAVRKQEVKLSSLDLNGFTPKEAAELRRRWEEFKAMRDRMYAEAVK